MRKNKNTSCLLSTGLAFFLFFITFGAFYAFINFIVGGNPLSLEQVSKVIKLTFWASFFSTLGVIYKHFWR